MQELEEIKKRNSIYWAIRDFFDEFEGIKNFPVHVHEDISFALTDVIIDALDDKFHSGNE